MEDLKENSSINQDIDKSVWYYKVPATRSKEDALNLIMGKIDSGKHNFTSVKTSNLRLLRVSMSAAASLVLLVACYFYFATVTFEGSKEVSSFRLPDRSRVLLTSQSKVTFKKFIGNRRIKLIGEGYFEVEKGEKFSVFSKQGRVDVLGTRFRVTDNGKDYSVECFEGKVQARLTGEKGQLLTAGNLFSKGKVSVIDGNREGKGYPAFALFRQSYSGAQLGSIIADLEKFFGISIRLNVPDDRQLSCKFNTGNPEAAIAITCSALDLNYKIIDNQYIIEK